MDPTSSRRTQQAQYYFAGEHAQEREYAQVRERRHSTLCALMDPELLMMHSVSKSEVSYLSCSSVVSLVLLFFFLFFLVSFLLLSSDVFIRIFTRWWFISS